MSNSQPNLQIKDFISFSEIVTKHMKSMGMSQQDLIAASGLSRTTISRICRNSDDKGSTYHVDDIRVVMAIAVGLKLTSAQFDELIFIAFPELHIVKWALDHSLDIHDVNIELYEQGLSPLGKFED